ncbi:MAG: hypothetical protein DRN54_02000 [Thaumarchaeota archaeon]|nr:MAG: hypothetical protein DRN54_02000 [Nitrososphaerota archaeon]
MRVLVDTSFLLLCVEKGRDLIALAEEKLGEPLECYVLEDVLNELKSLEGRAGRRGAFASLALRIAERFRKMGGGEDLPPDERLLREAERIGAAIATVDLELLEKARRKGIPVISVGADQRIRFEGVRL